jgi:quercetin dioxygenase-like cupin family protein
MAVSPESYEVHDPVVGYWLSFEREGENLIINTRVAPGGSTPAHVHPNGDERFVLHEGKVEYRIGRRRVVAEKGAELVVPRGTKHAFKNIGETDAFFRADLIPEPSQQGEAMFLETAAAAEQGMYTRRGIPTSPRAALHLLSILERYQEVLVFTSPPPALQRLLFPLARRFHRRAVRKASKRSGEQANVGH